MKLQFVFSQNPRPGIYSETEARKLFHQSRKGNIFLVFCPGEKDNHFFWYWEHHIQKNFTPLFDEEITPENLTREDLFLIEENNFFNYQNHIYYLYKKENEGLKVGEIEVCTTWIEAEIWSQIYGLDTAKSYIARVFHITDDRIEPLKLLGYCWRIYNHSHIHHAPLFYDDFDRIKNINFLELSYEMVEPGETILHNSERWKVYQQEKDNFFIRKSPCQLKINPIINL